MAVAGYKKGYLGAVCGTLFIVLCACVWVLKERNTSEVIHASMNLTPHWQHHVKRPITSNIALDEEKRVYFVADNNTVVCISEEGIDLWMTPLNLATSKSLAVDNRGVAVLLNTGTIKWLDRKDGSEISELNDVPSNAKIRSASNLLLTSLGPVFFSMEPPGLMFFSNDGTGSWFHRAKGHVVDSTISYDERSKIFYYLSAPGILYCVGDAGELKWERELTTNSSPTDVWIGGSCVCLDSTLTVAHNNTIKWFSKAGDIEHSVNLPSTVSSRLLEFQSSTIVTTLHDGLFEFDVNGHKQRHLQVDDVLLDSMVSNNGLIVAASTRHIYLWFPLNKQQRLDVEIMPDTGIILDHNRLIFATRSGSLEAYTTIQE